MVFQTVIAGAQNINPNLDTALSRRLEADEYGMKMYQLIILKSGINKTSDKHFKDSCFAGHLENIRNLANQKKLIVAGPFNKNDADFRGLFILNVKTKEEVELILASDPAIQNNFLKPEIYPWYGSAALPEYLPFHDKIWKNNP
jgi:uncharacterized protein YciI